MSPAHLFCTLGRLPQLGVLCLELALLTTAFNIDEKQFQSVQKPGSFGYKVLHNRREGERGYVVTAPLGNSGTGDVYLCAGENCTSLHFEASDSMRSIGMSLAIHPTSAEFTACSPSYAHSCDSNSYLNSICYQFSRQQLTLNFTPLFQECTKRKVDVVFLLDGSESMKVESYDICKSFISTIMKNFTNSSIQFAAVEYSTNATNLFDFNDYKKGQALEKLRKAQQARGLGNVAVAIKYVAKSVFTEEKGSNPEASKALILIIHDSPTQKIDNNLINDLKKRNVIRFIIKVGEGVKLIEHLASDPRTDSIIGINDYNELNKILSKLEEKIYNIEGTSNAHGRKFTRELSQSGFSTVYLQDKLVLGSVGSNDWRGSLYQYSATGSQNMEITDPQMTEDSYMGYSVVVGKKSETHLYFSGAPRFEHVGQVQIFSLAEGNWTVQHREDGRKIGSYFGGELCALDLNSDGETDFLLVGAPLHYESFREGRMFVFHVTTKLGLQESMNVSGISLGRFASAISAVQDLNGDGLQDVAVGAPLENNARGALYIYLGQSQHGIRPLYSQHVVAERLSQHLRYFGLSVDGNMGQEGGGVTDILVGANNTVVLLRSKPVSNITVELDFFPKEISTDKFDGVSKDSIPVVTLCVCFTANLTTLTTAGSYVGMSYQLELDSRRQESRAHLMGQDVGSRRQTFQRELPLGRSCFNHTVYMQHSVKETVLPVTVKLNFSQSQSQNLQASAVLNPDSKAVTHAEVPFKKNCRNETCIAELHLDFSFLTPTLVVVDQDYFNVTVTLTNQGDDSYNNSLIFTYPAGLSFSRIQVQQASRRTLTDCSGEQSLDNQTVCRIHPVVFSSQTTATFHVLFRISSNSEWSERMTMSIEAKSDNKKVSNIDTSSKTKTIAVQFAVDVAVKALKEISVTYMNFSLEEREKNVEHVFEVKNTGLTTLPMRLNITFPSQLGSHFAIHSYQLQYAKEITLCGGKVDANSTKCLQCQMITCNISSLKRQTSQRLVLSGKASVKHNAALTENLSFHRKKFSTFFQSEVQIDYDRQRYVQITSITQKAASSTDFHRAQIESQAELIILPNQLFIVGVGAGGGFVLLILIFIILFKLGFFKRKRLNPEAAAEDQAESRLEEETGGLFSSEEEEEVEEEEEEEEEQKGGESTEVNNLEDNV